MIRFVPVLLILASMMCQSVSSMTTLSVFQQQALDEHNLKRQLHCTGPLKLNSTLNAIAQAYAKYLAVNNLFQHSGAPGLGENLWSISSSVAINNVDGSSPSNSWYNEISSYDYHSPGFSSSTGHFTQVIWKGSTYLGIGIAFGSDGKTAKVVANYYPAGNVIGSFPANVLPLCSATTTTPRPTTTTSRKTTATTTRQKTTSTTTRRRRRNKRVFIEN